MTGSYNNFFRIFDLNKKDVTLEASKNWIKPKAPLKPKKVTQKAPLVLISNNRIGTNKIFSRSLTVLGRKKKKSL